MHVLHLFRARLGPSFPPLVRSVHNAPPPPPKKSPHGQWYSDVVPSMIPIFLLGSAVYLGLQLTQQKLSHEKYMQEAQERVHHLEEQVESYQRDQAKQELAQLLMEQASSPTPNSPPAKNSRWWW